MFSDLFLKMQKWHFWLLKRVQNKPRPPLSPLQYRCGGHLGFRDGKGSPHHFQNIAPFKFFKISFSTRVQSVTLLSQLCGLVAHSRLTYQIERRKNGFVLLKLGFNNIVSNFFLCKSCFIPRLLVKTDHKRNPFRNIQKNCLTEHIGYKFLSIFSVHKSDYTGCFFRSTRINTTITRKVFIRFFIRLKHFKEEISCY